MKPESPDPLSEAASRLRKAPEADIGSRGDICELFLAELRSRRERLESWLNLLDKQARQEYGATPHRRRRAGSPACHSRRVPARAQS